MKDNVDWEEQYNIFADELNNLFEKIDFGWIDFEYPLTANDIIEGHNELVYGDVLDAIRNNECRQLIEEIMSPAIFQEGQEFYSFMTSNEKAFHMLFQLYSKYNPDKYFYWIYEDYERQKDNSLKQMFKYSWLPSKYILCRKEIPDVLIDLTNLYELDEEDKLKILECIKNAKRRFDSKAVETTPVIFTNDEKMKAGGDANPETGIVRININKELFKNIKPKDKVFVAEFMQLLTHEFSHIRQYERGYVGLEREGFSDMEIMAELETLLRGGVLDMIEAQKNGHDIWTYYSYMYDPEDEWQFDVLEDYPKLATKLAVNDWFILTNNDNVESFSPIKSDEIDKILNTKKKETFLWKAYVNDKFETPNKIVRDRKDGEFMDRIKVLKTVPMNKLKEIVE